MKKNVYIAETKFKVMKIKEIKRKEGSYNVYIVTFKPNWLEKLLGVEEKRREYKDTGRVYIFGGCREYIKKMVTA